MKKSETLSKLIGVKVTSATKALVLKDCDKLDRSESYVIRKIIEQYYSDNQAKKVK